MKRIIAVLAGVLVAACLTATAFAAAPTDGILDTTADNTADLIAPADDTPAAPDVCKICRFAFDPQPLHICLFIWIGAAFLILFILALLLRKGVKKLKKRAPFWTKLALTWFILLALDVVFILWRAGIIFG